MEQRSPYPSDSADEQWALIEPVVTSWKRERVPTTSPANTNASTPPPDQAEYDLTA
ncbi:hypothetical protein [Streptomyces sp. 3N207]|uniref:hypothetical protein n=1 Tax=Streptomyces sp. 3N207 TaxID=3457417 RepID=UPI003FD65B30